MTTGISLKNIRKQFDTGGASGGPMIAVNDITLEIEPGEMFFLLGPSGCGKTTLLRMIAGFIEPTNGRILFGTRDVTSLSPNKRNAGMVFQSYALWPHMTVESNVRFGLGVRKVDSHTQAIRAHEALRSVHMESLASRKPTQLSGGQQQRVALARALVVSPDVLLLDEPLSNLDAKLRNELRQEIRRICKSAGMTAVYVTHDQREALSMADRIAVLNAGSLIQVGTPVDLYRRPRNKFVASFLGESNFIQGTISEVRGQTAVVKTAIGMIRATRVDETLDVGSQVECSIRPDAWRVSSVGFQGTIRHSEFLGSTEQLTVELSGGIQVSYVRSWQAGSASEGSEVLLAVGESDAVVIGST